jgi:hypothetical protein
VSEFKSHAEVKMGSERGFGIIFAIVFLIVGVYPLSNAENLRLWALAVALVLLLMAFLAPKALTIPNKLWFKFGIALGSIIAPIVMALLYFVSVAPIGLILRAMGKDLLRQKMDKDAPTYWINRDEPVGSMKDQF